MPMHWRAVISSGGVDVQEVSFHKRRYHQSSFSVSAIVFRPLVASCAHNVHLTLIESDLQDCELKSRWETRVTGTNAIYLPWARSASTSSSVLATNFTFCFGSGAAPLLATCPRTASTATYMRFAAWPAAVRSLVRVKTLNSDRCSTEAAACQYDAVWWHTWCRASFRMGCNPGLAL